MHWSWQGFYTAGHSFTPRAKQVLEFHRAGFTDGAEPHKHRASAAGHSARGERVSSQSSRKPKRDLHHLEQQLHGVEG